MSRTTETSMNVCPKPTAAGLFQRMNGTNSRRGRWSLSAIMDEAALRDAGLARDALGRVYATR